MTNIMDSGEVIDHGAETIRMQAPGSEGGNALPDETLRLNLGDRTLNLAPYDVTPPPLRRSNADAETAIVRLPQSIGIVAPCAQPDADIDVPLDGFDPGGYPPVPRPTPPPPPSMLLDAAETVTQLTVPDGPPPAPLPAPGGPPRPSWAEPIGLLPAVERGGVEYAAMHRGVPGRHRAPDPAWLKWLVAVGVLLIVVAVLGIVITAVMS